MSEACPIGLANTRSSFADKICIVANSIGSLFAISTILPVSLILVF
jgi:hypothetical protein